MSAKITCNICNKKFKKIYEHYDTCAYNKYKNKSGYLVMLHSYGTMGHIYYMHTIMGTEVNFKQIDKLIRKTWCECCNHLSEFEKYINPENPKKTTTMKKQKLMSDYKEEDKFKYTYDFGSSTVVFIQIIKKLNGEEENNNIKVVLRNTNPIIKCTECSKNAYYYVNDEPICKKCSKEYSDNDNLLKIVNSPRTGICGYE